MTTHPTDDALSDLLDDPATPAATHVASCAPCSERVEAWHAARRALREAPGLPAERIDAAVAAAVERHVRRGIVPAASRRRTVRLLPLAAAAVVAVLLGVVAVTTLRNGDGDGDRTQAALRDEAGGGGAGEVAALDGGDLGDVDGAALDARIRAVLASPAPTAEAAEDRATPFAAEGAPGSTAPAAQAPAAAPKAGRAVARSGPPPCLRETRAVGGDRLGALVYRADARLDGVAVVVLGFRTSSPAGPLGNIVFAVDRRDCQPRQTVFL